MKTIAIIIALALSTASFGQAPTPTAPAAQQPATVVIVRPWFLLWPRTRVVVHGPATVVVKPGGTTIVTK